MKAGVLGFSLLLSTNLYSFHACQNTSFSIIFCILSLCAYNMPAVYYVGSCSYAWCWYCVVWKHALDSGQLEFVVLFWVVDKKYKKMIIVLWTAGIISYNSSPVGVFKEKWCVHEDCDKAVRFFVSWVKCCNDTHKYMIIMDWNLDCPFHSHFSLLPVMYLSYEHASVGLLLVTRSNAVQSDRQSCTTYLIWSR